VEIGRSPHDVFAYLTDASNLPRWQASALSADADGPVRLGTHICERRKFAGRDVRTELEVVTYEPPRRFDVESRGGPVSFAIHHTLEPRNGGTHLAVDVNVKIGAMMRIAAAGPLKVAEREFRSDFQHLKEVLETET
jgi:uncharacterized protein YndB with AHSA1/START domain